MQIVIDVPEEMYKWVNDVNKFFDDYGTSDFIDLIKNGTPLPKGHGDLIDRNKIEYLKAIHDLKWGKITANECATKIRCSAPAIIGADTGSEE